LCNCNPLFGTEAMRAIEAARELGLDGTAKYMIRYDEQRGRVDGDRCQLVSSA